MAKFQIESGVCNGRGFAGVDTNGIMAKFHAWVQKTAALGGAEWTILRDKSANPVPATCTFDYTTNTITQTSHGYVTGDLVVFATDGTLPSGISAGGGGYWVKKIDANSFQIYDRLRYIWQATAKNFNDNGTGNHTSVMDGPYIVISDNASPANANTVCKIIKIGYVSLEAGYIRVSGWLSWNSTTTSLNGMWWQRKIATLDDADFAYDFRGGEEQMIIQTRIGTDWDTVVLDEWVGDSNLVEGTDKIGTTVGAITAGDDVVVQMGVGEGSNFTKDNFYYLYNFANECFVEYVKVTGVGTGDGLPSADHIKLEYVTWDFNSGAVIGAYPHRFYNMSNNSHGTDWYLSRYKSQVPYGSYYSKGDCANYAQESPIVMDFVYDSMYYYITKMAPNDLGVYAVQKPGWTENRRPNDYLNSGGMNRGYGVLKNVYLTLLGSMARGQDGRTITGKNYLYFQRGWDLVEGGNTNLAMLFLDTESTS